MRGGGRFSCGGWARLFLVKHSKIFVFSLDIVHFFLYIVGVKRRCFVVGFSGSRSLSSSSPAAVLLAACVRGAVASGAPVAVGCASGADALVRSLCSSARVFAAASSSPAALAARSVAFVRALAAVAGSLLVSAPSGLCPRGVFPSRAWVSGASPSGSWSSLALAVGLGVSVFVVGLPASSLPAWWGGSWVASSRFGVAGFSFRSPVLSLFGD